MSPLGRRSSLRGTVLAALATVAVVTGGVIGARQIPTGGGGGVTNTANLWVDLNGGTCTRSSSAVAYVDAAACGTMDAAYQAATQGDTVRVRSASYPVTTAGEGAYKINADAGKTSSTDVTFLCDNGAVTFAPPSDQVVIFAKHLTIQGSCFTFQHLWIGGAPYAVYTDDVTVDGVNMQAFEITGSTNITIENSTIGPSFACLAPGNGGASCQNNAATGEDYWFGRGVANTSYPEPKIHNGGGTQPSNVLIYKNHFDLIQTRDSTSAHTGCLWLGWQSAASPIIIRGNTFERCAIYDAHIEDAPNMVWENNFLGPSMEPAETGTNYTTETSTSQQDVQYKCNVGTATDYLVRFNTFTHGINLDFGSCGNSTTNARLIGNLLGVNSNCLANTKDFNISSGSSCGTNASTATMANLLTSTAIYPIDYHLKGSAGSTAADNYVTPTGSDYSLTTDIDGQSRTAGSRDAGADER